MKLSHEKLTNIGYNPSYLQFALYRFTHLPYLAGNTVVVAQETTFVNDDFI